MTKPAVGLHPVHGMRDEMDTVVVGLPGLRLNRRPTAAVLRADDVDAVRTIPMRTAVIDGRTIRALVGRS